MIRHSVHKVARKIHHLFSSTKSPIIFSNGRSTFSLSQVWSGIGEKPFDYFVHDDLQV